MAHAELSKEKIKKLAMLSRIAVTDPEIEGLQKDFSSILEYISILESVELPESVEPVPPALLNSFRPDVQRVDETDREALLSQFPKRSGDYLKLKEVIEGGGR